MPAFLSVGRDGSSFYKVHSAQLPNGQTVVGASLVWRLPASRLTELQRLLEATDWLTAKGGEGRALHTDAAMMTLSVTRGGKTKSVLLQGTRPAPYDTLQKFFFDLAWQEDLYHQLTALPDNRREALSAFHSSVEGALGLPGRARPSHYLDYERFHDLFLQTLDRWDTSSTEELRAAVDLMLLLKHREHAGKIARLRNDRDMNLRSVVARALPVLADEKSIPWLAEMISSTPEARIQLIRMGKPAVPIIAEIIAEDDVRENPPSVALIRAYIDDWKSLTQPVDAKIIQSVIANTQRESRRDNLQYQREFLKLAGVPEPDPATVRETAELFLKQLKAGDRAELDKLKDNLGSVEEWLTLRDLCAPEADLKIEVLLVDKTSAFLQTRPLKDKVGDEIRLVAWLNLLRGTDWRVGPALSEPAQRNLYKDRFLKSHPEAQESPADGR